MQKKESLKKEDSFQPKSIGIPSKIFNIIKLVLAICFLPFVYSISISFLNEFSVIDKSVQKYFWSGIITLIILYLFIWEPALIYSRGQKLLELVFSFFKPLVRVAPYVLPIYTILMFILYWLLSLLFSHQRLVNIFVFLFGFSLALHLVFSAKSLRSKQQDYLKANYIFGFSFIYILNLAIVTLCLNFIFNEFSFVNFFNNSFQSANNIFGTVFKQLF